VLESDPEANGLHSWLQVAGFRVADSLQPRSSLHLDLAPEPDRLFAAFARTHRADVRRAERAGVTVRVGTTLADLEAFYTIMKVTAERAGFGVHSRDYYRRAWELVGESARLLIASDASGADVAAFLIFAVGHEGQYMYSGANAAGLKSYANYLLQWNAIRWVRERGCQLYDFWGIPDAAARLLDARDDAERSAIEQELEAHPLYGVYLFKKAWGGRIVRYLPAYDQVYLAPAYWLWQKRRRGE
jgi:lipid II:glycine glycyltransferase (peptidoglycan interpeptide bridge formation enzyme)